MKRKILISLRLDESIADRLSKIAEEQNRSRSNLIESILAEKVS